MVLVRFIKHLTVVTMTIMVQIQARLGKVVKGNVATSNYLSNRGPRPEKTGSPRGPSFSCSVSKEEEAPIPMTTVNISDKLYSIGPTSCNHIKLCNEGQENAMIKQSRFNYNHTHTR